MTPGQFTITQPAVAYCLTIPRRLSVRNQVRVLARLKSLQPQAAGGVYHDTSHAQQERFYWISFEPAAVNHSRVQELEQEIVLSEAQAAA
jgi:hypothetical protein